MHGGGRRRFMADTARLFEDFLVVGLVRANGIIAHNIFYHLHKGAPEADAIVEVRGTAQKTHAK